MMIPITMGTAITLAILTLMDILLTVVGLVIEKLFPQQLALKGMTATQENLELM